MIKQLEIKKDSIVYIACPAQSITGGPELLHQLCDKLIKLGIDARMYYYPNNVVNPKPQDYSRYNTPIATNISDNSKNILIVPEVYTELHKKYKNIQKVIWWLSVDNFYKKQYFKSWKFLFIRIINKIAHTFKFPIIIDMRNFELSTNYINKFRFKDYIFGNNIIHFVQSEYAKQHLLQHKIKPDQIYYLSDYINKDFIISQNNNHNDKREDIVLYNPKKGYSFTEKLMKIAPDLKWVPLVNLSRSEVINYLQKSKVYIDFGNHPGKDRFPREAAICGCCVITGKRGSANYYEDVPIPEKYKFADTEENLYKIIDCIRDCLDNYDQRKKDFEEYRQFIINEEEKFKQDVQKIFSP
ncbi:hypothetical protein [Tepidibacillus sp. LV47]|uniref:hypothetical protein n=1 Tax=Tepidibacillus sp. LV47 TaxID=3398228 RepID=UPI003AAB7EFC